MPGFASHSNDREFDFRWEFGESRGPGPLLLFRVDACEERRWTSSCPKCCLLKLGAFRQKETFEKPLFFMKSY